MFSVRNNQYYCIHRHSLPKMEPGGANTEAVAVKLEKDEQGEKKPEVSDEDEGKQEKLGSVLSEEEDETTKKPAAKKKKSNKAKKKKKPTKRKKREWDVSDEEEAKDGTNKAKKKKKPTKRKKREWDVSDEEDTPDEKEEAKDGTQGWMMPNPEDWFFENKYIQMLKSEVLHPFGRENEGGDTGMGAFFVNGSNKEILLPRGKVMGIYGADRPKLTGNDVEAMEQDDLNYVLEVNDGFTGEQFFINARESTGWTGRINHAFTVDNTRFVIGANVGFRHDGRIEMLTDLRVLPGEKVELLADYGWGYWHFKLFPEEEMFSKMTAENKELVRSRLAALVPNNFLTLHPHEALEYSLFWSQRNC